MWQRYTGFWLCSACFYCCLFCVFCCSWGRRSNLLLACKHVLLNLCVHCFSPWNHSPFGFGAPSKTGFIHSSVCQLWVEHRQLISVFMKKKTQNPKQQKPKHLEGKILAGWGVLLMLLTFPKSVDFLGNVTLNALSKYSKYSLKQTYLLTTWIWSLKLF